MITALAVNPQNELNTCVSELIDKGYCPFPMKAGAKYPPPKNLTGNRAKTHTVEEMRSWWEHLESEEKNIGLRLQAVAELDSEMEVIALDIDDYLKADSEPDAVLGYQGFLQFAKQAGLTTSEAEDLLDSTVRISRREASNPSGHYLFLVPAGRKWASEAGSQVDVLQHGHRYSLAPGSVVDGMVYNALDGRSERPREIPAANTLPVLPEVLQAALKPGARSGSIAPLCGHAEELEAWLDENTFEPLAGLNETTPMGKTYARWVEALEEAGAGSRHDVVTKAFYSMFVSAVKEGHEGCLTAAISFQESVREVYESSGDTHRVDSEVNQLWQAVEKVRGEVAAGRYRSLYALCGGDLGALEINLPTKSKGDPENSVVSVSDGLNGSKGATVAGLRLQSLDTVQSTVPDWAWKIDGYGAIPLGGLTIITGKGGDGKSTLCRWLAARISKGELEGMWHGEPHSVIYLAAEESLSIMVKPSFLAAGADTSRVHYISTDGVSNRFDPTRDMDALISQCIEEDVRAVFVDPITNYFGKKDSYKSSEVRDALAPWSRLADEINGVVVAIAHQTKGAGGDITAGVGGSSAITEVARAVLGTAHDKETDVRVLSGGKNNAGALLPAFEYQLKKGSVRTDDGKEAVAVAFELGRRSQFTADEVQLRNKARTSGETQTAKDWLRELLMQAGGEGMRKSEIVTKAIGLFSESSLEKAKKDLRLVKTTQDNKAVWSLPA